MPPHSLLYWKVPVNFGNYCYFRVTDLRLCLPSFNFIPQKKPFISKASAGLWMASTRRARVRSRAFDQIYGFTDGLTNTEASNAVLDFKIRI